MTARYWITTIAAVAAALVTTLATDEAQADAVESDSTALVVGAHLHTFHVGNDDAPPEFRINDSTPGLYVRTASGLTAGIVRNSLRRTSLYVAQSWSTDDERWSLSLGVISGYKHRKHYGQRYCPPGNEHRPDLGAPCSYKYGQTTAHLRALVAPSWAWIEARQYIGATPRVTLLGKGVHLSVEASWR